MSPFEESTDISKIPMAPVLHLQFPRAPFWDGSIEAAVARARVTSLRNPRHRNRQPRQARESLLNERCERWYIRK
jgi:hypothetical protein